MYQTVGNTTVRVILVLILPPMHAQLCELRENILSRLYASDYLIQENSTSQILVFKDRYMVHCYVSDNFQNPRSKLGQSSISLVQFKCCIEVFLTSSIRPWEAEAVKLDLPKAKSPSYHLASASTLSEQGWNKPFATKIHQF